jgi:hypothetical protein
VPTSAFFASPCGYCIKLIRHLKTPENMSRKQQRINNACLISNSFKASVLLSD